MLLSAIQILRKKKSEGCLLMGILIVIKVVESLSNRQYYFYSRRIGMRPSLMVAVYQRQLKLSNIGRQNYSTGEIANYIAVDLYRMREFPMWLHMWWILVVLIFFCYCCPFLDCRPWRASRFSTFRHLWCSERTIRKVVAKVSERVHDYSRQEVEIIV